LKGHPQHVVALKIAHSTQAASAFAGEAVRAFLGLTPRLVELVDLGVLRHDEQVATVVTEPLDECEAFLALRWLEGKPLGIGKVDDPLQLALTVARDIGGALADLHAAGLAHGDIKPTNILIDGGQASLIDLGLCGPAFASALQGATPRYLATTDPKLGNARARDMLALGLVLAEIASIEVGSAAHPLAAARACKLSPPLDRICAALLAPNPGARPSAGWVCSLAGGAQRQGRPDAARGSRQLRAAYLRLRRHEIGRARVAQRDTASWLAPAIAVVREARRMCERIGVEVPAELQHAEMRGLGPLSIEQRINWLASAVGSPAASWPSQQLAEATEPELERALTGLCEHKSPHHWCLADIDVALREQLELVEPAQWSHLSMASPLDPTTIAKLALAVARTPVDPGALEVIERHADHAPTALVVQAADALRLGGELGRARSLVLDREDGEAVAVDVLRRSGDTAQASALAREVIARNRDQDGRARACLARIHLDTGRIAEALDLLEEAEGTSAVAEVTALVEHRRGNISDALRQAQRSFALATTPEARARALATIAFVKRSTDPDGARRGYRQAVQHAIAAGAVLEEASYRTGEAAACVDLGELEAAVQTGRRAALLFEDVLRRAAMAARSWLACAAAFAALDVTTEACHAAERAMTLAQECGDTRAQLYACWSIADAWGAMQPRAVEATRRAAELLGEQHATDDGLHTAARILRHDPGRADAAFMQQYDDLAQHPSNHAAFCRLAWWGARAERLASSSFSQPLSKQASSVLTELVLLAETQAPLPTIGKAMYAAARLAAALGDTTTLQRVDTARRGAARRVAMNNTTVLAEAARSCAWLHRHSTVEEPLAPEQAIDIRQLVRALSERNSLRALLDQVLDVLLLWTGAERGLLLLRDPSDGKLIPRSARNLARDDLHDEQLAVSTSLAQRALETGEVVVAVDAMEELLNSFESVHTLRLRSVLALPLVAHGNVRGVVYLDDRMRPGVFAEREVAWAKAVAPVAALAISDAHTQKELRRAVRRAERATRKLEQALAQKESALDVAERELAKAVGARTTRFRYEEIIGESEALKQMLHIIDRVAVSDVPVLLRGESGSGKELVARAIHRNSPRAQRPFVGENCGALPESLLESALFGHVKGAFTGAHQPRVGLFEAASGGSLFLDEIGEMSLSMQTKLLRVLEDNLVRPVGSTRTRRVDVRVVAATHRDLEKMVSEGSFREDLYYRLNVITVTIPPLRERASDIPLLVDHLIAKHAQGRTVELTQAARQRLTSFAWPGNVRQLENELRRALLLCDDVINSEHLSITALGAEPRADVGLNVRARVDRLEVELVSDALSRTSGNQTQAAKLLGVSRYGLHKMMKRLGITAQRKSTRNATTRDEP